MRIEHPAWVYSAFSILGRIGGDATRRMACRSPNTWSFQYPRSDRRRCNRGASRSGWQRWELSVSSVGSEAMQRICGVCGARGVCGFQYPRSDRRRCNPHGHRAARRVLVLSVSSVGSEAMQPVAACAVRVGGSLSVSSVGSEAMQRGNSDAAGPIRAQPFSILGRIGGDATNRRWMRCWTGKSRLSVSSVGSEAMQPGGRPRAGRAGCRFQYPRSDRRRCNHEQRFCLPDHHQVLSVSSVGSEAMQRWPAAGPGQPEDRLSVSSVGSEAMQRRCYRSRSLPPRPFSILGRIGGDAT